MGNDVMVRLCVESFHPIDPGNYEGPIHCVAHPQGYPCTTALYGEIKGTKDTAADRQAACESLTPPPSVPEPKP